MKARYFWIVICALALVIFALIFVMVPKVSVGLIQNNCIDCNAVDSIQIAAELGRLDIVSLCLAFLGIGVGFFAIFSFFAIKEDAEETARRTVDKEFEARWRSLASQNRNQINSLFQTYIATQQASYSIEDVDTSNREMVTEDDY